MRSLSHASRLHAITDYSTDAARLAAAAADSVAFTGYVDRAIGRRGL
mgnify:CR=1 FL=1